MTTNDEETLCGGRFNKYKENFENILMKLSEHAKLVFFEDGPVVDGKLRTWIDRHSTKYKETYDLMQKIYSGQSLQDILASPKRNEISKVTTQTEMMEQVARNYGKLIVTFTRECDSEIARYAYKNEKVLAILADDSDFLIYPGHWRYFSLRNLDPKTLNTYEYSRNALRSLLNLSDRELIILSTLNGNDIIDYKKVRDNFHIRMDSFKSRFPDFRFAKLAECVKSLSRLESERGQQAMFEKIHKLIGYGGIELVEESFEMYNPVFDVEEFTDDLHRLCYENYYMFTYAILMKTPITSTVAYFDMAVCPTIIDAKTELFKKQVGIILSNMPERCEMGYEIVTKKTHNEDYRSHWVRPEKYEDLPPLIELLDRPNYPEHDDIRFKLLKMIIGVPRMKNYDFRTFPKNYLQDILTLVVLRHHKLIEQYEADLILLTIKHVETNTIPEELEVPAVLNEKAFRTSFLFSKFHMYLDRTFQVTGLRDFAVNMQIINNCQITLQ